MCPQSKWFRGPHESLHVSVANSLEHCICHREENNTPYGHKKQLRFYVGSSSEQSPFCLKTNEKKKNNLYNSMRNWTLSSFGEHQLFSKPNIKMKCCDIFL